jgi:hypothetical protein
VRGRGTCDAWACNNPAVGHRSNGHGTYLHLCAGHLPADCPDCDRPVRAGITGELRCRRCDEGVEQMVRGWWEESVAAGELDDEEVRQ